MTPNLVSGDQPNPPLDASMLNGLPDPVFMVDHASVIVGCNSAARDLLGPKVLGDNLDQVLSNKRIVETIVATLKGKPKSRPELSLTYPNGRDYQLRLWRLPDLRSAGPAWAMVIMHDITDVNKAAQLRADFVANVSHELRSPLSSLLGFIETIRGPARNDPDTTERFLEIMESEAKRMSRLIDDLLTLSTVETQEHIRPTASVALAPLLQRVTETLSVQAKERDMKIILDAPPDLPLVIGEPDELTQVFQNLIANAVSYGTTKTSVVISTSTHSEVLEESDTNVSVAVLNQGEGIEPADLDRLTERFYRADKSRSRSMGGTGLGLAIVKHIVARHRGRLDIKSTLNDETSFTVHLPCDKS